MSLATRHLATALVLLIAGTRGSLCQAHAADREEALPRPIAMGAVSQDTEDDVLQRFVAVHGRRSLVDGYAAKGLEIWAGPFQLLSGYRVAFRADGTTTPVRGEEILRRIVYAPDSIMRIYVGPDFVVREKLFVPLDEPGAILTYQVQSTHSVNIEVHATPVLDLMWPAAMGGQSVVWDGALSAYVLSEPAYGYTAVAASPNLIAHDDIGNRTIRGVGDSGIGFTLRPDSSGAARVFVALNPPHASDAGALLRSLMRDRPKLEAEAVGHYAELAAHALQIETPDPQVNHALAWAETAIDQAWVCNPQLGCGMVAGYGPSRMARRPQYDWFFAGDGLVATDALVSEGEYARARQELAFILRWQDAKTGMIWHELSQSAGFLDWAGKYPYMFAHVDITFQFLITMEHYVTASGDSAFLRENWSAIEAADAYCRTLIDPADGLPHIPANREGGNEQDREADDLGLSASWVSASEAFARMATLTGHAAEAGAAKNAAALARSAIPGRYWNSSQSFWIQGHSAAGQALPEQRSSPAGALSLHLFSAQQNADLLDQLASSSFQTDWGARTIGAESAGFDPESYAKGSVFALGTSDVAAAFWSEHRPLVALPIWDSLLPWFSLDSMGHLHEVLSGNVYRAQMESVPEQTWSSAGFLTAAVHGLLGLEVDSLSRRIVFAPHLPAAWPGVSIANLRLSDAAVGLALRRTNDGFTLEVDNPAAPFHLEFAPEIPLGARLGGADVNHRPITAVLRSYPQDEHASIDFDVPHGKSEVHLGFTGGVSVVAQTSRPLVGDVSVGLRLVSVHLVDRQLTIVADVPKNRDSHIDIRTRWEIADTRGSSARRIAADMYELDFASSGATSVGPDYVRATATVMFRMALLHG